MHEHEHHDHGSTGCCSHDYQYTISFVIGIGIAYCILRQYVSGGVCSSKAKLNGKTAIVTGSNTGIGKETARDLASRGARVILACRDLVKAESAAAEIINSTKNENVVVRKLDLASLASVRKFANEILETEEAVHILINNAGIAWCPEWKTEDGFEMQMGVNHLGHFLLTNLLLDKIKESSPARIINVSSSAHKRVEMDFEDFNSKKNYSRMRTYGKSKLANILFTRELSRRLSGTDVTANSLHPGFVTTELTRYTHLLIQLLVQPFCVFLKTPEQGAQTTIYCAVSEELEGVSGKYFSDCAIERESKAAQSAEDAARLWKMSEEMVGLRSS